MNYTKQEWLKSPEEMYAIFSDCPQALENTIKNTFADLICLSIKVQKLLKSGQGKLQM